MPDEHRALIELLHGPPDSPPATDGPPDFDGGARRTMAGPADPVADHNALIVGLCRGGGDMATYEWEMRQRNPGGRW